MIFNQLIYVDDTQNYERKEYKINQISMDNTKVCIVVIYRNSKPDYKPIKNIEISIYKK